MTTVDPPLAFQPPRVYVLKPVWDNPDAARRAERFAAACPGAKVHTIGYDDLPAVVVEEGWDRFPKMGTLKVVPPPIPLLGLFDFDRARQQATAKRMRDAYRGTGGFNWDLAAGGSVFNFFHSGTEHFKCESLREIRPNPQHVCRACWRLNQGAGCAHQCAYCSLGGVLINHVNVDDYIAHLAQLVARNPWQKTYLLDDAMDVPTLEPQLDMLAPLMRFFESTRDRYLIIHTKTDRTAGFLRANAPRNTIIAWSLSGPTQSAELEKVAGTTDGRIEAARECQAAGFTVRFKFKPIVPVPHWREDAAYMVARLFERTRPDNLSMTVIMWMDVDTLRNCIGERWLDSTCLAAAEAAKTELKDQQTGPFPVPVRAEIYRHHLREIRKHNADIPVTMSTESLEMWKLLGPEFGVRPGEYVCGCGPNATPGKTRLDVNPWQDCRATVCWDGSPVFAADAVAPGTG